jgi:hypothetical protein
LHRAPVTGVNEQQPLLAAVAAYSLQQLVDCTPVFSVALPTAVGYRYRGQHNHKRDAALHSTAGHSAAAVTSITPLLGGITMRCFSALDKQDCRVLGSPF